MKKKLSQYLSLLIKSLKIVAYFLFIVSVIGSWVMNWWGDKLLADKLALNALLLLAVITFYEVTRLKEWGQKNLSDLIKAADTAAKACDDLTANGGKVEINSKGWRA
ncbi:hypothetical protein NSA18_12180 [Pasteurella caecimuris]|uniref:hypothetical protein n=1 Tax=Rodentibacter caecimuris TaxID=1796644 RepID=UPI0021504316|nr:hypothetical protein [Pasteurella caecimuris]MCR1838632.1 hypothetical protein [Pasteurella caecimuris]MCU0108066.1 hypothetical protein [Pasteurella caecimuris]